ncbi:uncharacterized protein LOC122805946 [Protopterus annectens]|uniref:uncharacterized protein LOC122805946 n=1 Tax=Protopterus annectens TaxID=7888 RepID=UPI001CFA307D|nr:uncharacterized protein LOC122805946 [Protopterus annectens]
MTDGSVGGQLTALVGDLMWQAFTRYMAAQISHAAILPSLSDKYSFPSFLRTMPSGEVIAEAIANLLFQFQWMWVGLLYTDNDYGHQNGQILRNKIAKNGGCIEFSELIPILTTKEKNQHTVDIIGHSTAKVVVIIATEYLLFPLIEEISRQNITGKVWVSYHSYCTYVSLNNKGLFSTLSGMIDIAVHKGEIPQFQEYVYSLYPWERPDDIFTKQFWESAFNCKLPYNTSGAILHFIGLSEETVMCTGEERLALLPSSILDIYQLRFTYNVYNAIYAFVYALHNMFSCNPGNGPFDNHTCGTYPEFQPWQLLHYVKNVHFKNKVGDTVYFDKNGDPPGVLDIVNWQITPSDTIQHVHVGSINVSAPQGQEFRLNRSAIIWQAAFKEILTGKKRLERQAGIKRNLKNPSEELDFETRQMRDEKVQRMAVLKPNSFEIPLKLPHLESGEGNELIEKGEIWNGALMASPALETGTFWNKTLLTANRAEQVECFLAPKGLENKFQQTPQSVCSESCSPGYRKASRPGQSVCCFDCIICSEGGITNHSDSVDCMKCPLFYQANERRDVCILKATEYLSYQDPLGVALSAVSISSSMMAALILGIFIKYRDTPVVKANNCEISYLLLLALLLCFLCSLLFIGYPVTTVCMFRQVSFGVIFAVSCSCVLAKTITVAIAFSATDPKSNLRRWVGPRLPYFILCSCSILQVTICFLWLVLSPPFQEMNMSAKPDTIIIQCNEGSVLAFWLMVGYLGILAVSSLIVAFFARKLPDSFNEAKFITFSILVFITVWLSFVPAYLSTKGKFMVAVEIFAILSSSAGLLSCIFFPKCYIILLKPEMNSKKYLLGKKK